MTRDDIYVLFNEIRSRKTSFTKMDYAYIKTKGIATLVSNDINLNTYKKDGHHLTIPHFHKVNLEPDSFEVDHVDYDEDGERKYQ